MPNKAEILTSVDQLEADLGPACQAEVRRLIEHPGLLQGGYHFRDMSSTSDCKAALCLNECLLIGESLSIMIGVTGFIEADRGRRHGKILFKALDDQG